MATTQPLKAIMNMKTSTTVTIKTQTNNNEEKLILSNFILFSRNSTYLLRRDRTLSACIIGDHSHVSRYKPYYRKDKLH